MGARSAKLKLLTVMSDIRPIIFCDHGPVRSPNHMKFPRSIKTLRRRSCSAVLFLSNQIHDARQIQKLVIQTPTNNSFQEARILLEVDIKLNLHRPSDKSHLNRPITMSPAPSPLSSTAAPSPLSSTAAPSPLSSTAAPSRRRSVAPLVAAPSPLSGREGPSFSSPTVCDLPPHATHKYKLWIALNLEAPSLDAETALQLSARLGYAVASQYKSFGVSDELYIVDYKSADGEVYPSLAWHPVVVFAGKDGGVSKFLARSRSALVENGGGKSDGGHCTAVAVRARLRAGDCDLTERDEEERAIAIHVRDRHERAYQPSPHEELLAVAVHAPEYALPKNASNKLHLFDGVANHSSDNDSVLPNQVPRDAFEQQSGRAPFCSVESDYVDTLLLAGFMKPGRAANVAGHLGLALGADRRIRLFLSNTMDEHDGRTFPDWEPQIVIVDGLEEASGSPIGASCEGTELLPAPGGRHQKVDNTRTTLQPHGRLTTASPLAVRFRKLRAQFDETDKDNQGVVAFLHTMETGGPVKQLEQTFATESSCMVFNGVAW